MIMGKELSNSLTTRKEKIMHAGKANSYSELVFIKLRIH